MSDSITGGAPRATAVALRDILLWAGCRPCQLVHMRPVAGAQTQHKPQCGLTRVCDVYSWLKMGQCKLDIAKAGKRQANCSQCQSL